MKALTCIFSIQQDNLQDLIQTDFIDDILLPASTDQQIQPELWRACSMITKNYYVQTMPTLWQKLMKVNSDQLPITPESLKFIETYANTMQENDLEWWKVMIENYLHKSSVSESPQIRSAACDCFASIPQHIFEEFHVRNPST